MVLFNTNSAGVTSQDLFLVIQKFAFTDSTLNYTQNVFRFDLVYELTFSSFKTLLVSDIKEPSTCERKIAGKTNNSQQIVE